MDRFCPRVYNVQETRYVPIRCTEKWWPVFLNKHPSKHSNLFKIFARDIFEAIIVVLTNWPDGCCYVAFSLPSFKICPFKNMPSGATARTDEAQRGNNNTKFIVALLRHYEFVPTGPILESFKNMPFRAPRWKARSFVLQNKTLRASTACASALMTGMWRSQFNCSVQMWRVCVLRQFSALPCRLTASCKC